MNPRIASIENLIASDPAGRNMFTLALADQLRLAAQSLRLAKRVGMVSGFYIPEAGAGETDGPPGAKVLGETLQRLGIAVDYITDCRCAPLFRALEIEPILETAGYLDSAQPTHLVSIERVGRGPDGRYRNMRGLDITDVTAPLDELFLEGTRRGLTTLAIGDGGNEIGMGKVFFPQATGAWAPSFSLKKGGGRNGPHVSNNGPSPTLRSAKNGAPGQSRKEPPRSPPALQCVVATDFCIVAGISNWGALGLAGALSVLEGRDLLPSAQALAGDFQRVVREGGAVDGVTHRREPTTDGQDLSATLRMLEHIRRHVAVSPLSQKESLLVGIVGYGETGRAAAALLRRHGHRVCLSDEGPVTLERGMTAAGVEAGGHGIELLGPCDVVMVSPGVASDHPIVSALHARGVYLISEMELAYQLGPARPASTEPACLRAPHRQVPTDSDTGSELPAASAGRTTGPELIAVTGTVGKRTTVELIQRLFRSAGRDCAIGGNRGRPLSALLMDPRGGLPVAVAVSSFQLETVVHFRPHIAVMLNLDEAHLDRHRSLAEYLRIKSRIFMNQGPLDALILPFDDDRLRALARKAHARTFFISSRQAVDRGAWLLEKKVWVNVAGNVEAVGRADPPFPENLLAAVLAARLSGLSPESIASGLKLETFKGVN